MNGDGDIVAVDLYLPPASPPGDIKCEFKVEDMLPFAFLSLIPKD